MMTFQQFLNEGIIKIPKETEQQMMDVIITAIEHVLTKRKVGKRKMKNLSSLKGETGVNKTEYHNGPAFGRVLTIKSEYLDSPFEITFDVPTFPALNDRTGAAFIQDKNFVIVNILSKLFITRLNDLVSKEFPKDLTRVYINSLVNSGKHEIAHAIQHELASKDKSKKITLQKKNGYNDPNSSELYHTSRIEFEPQVISSLNDFEELLTIPHAHNKPLSKKDAIELLRRFVGFEKTYNIEPSHFFDKIEDQFLKSLKKLTPRKHKDAVNKFYKEAMILINKLTEDGVLTK